ncbi:ZIP family metal transporter, partial [Candidatus Woesearchaeota archaeon]|nr:ZIP family metal transporter [Candidatus Woesearchaeota archaeon]
LYTIVSVLIVSLASLVGLALLSLKQKTLRAILLELVAFSIGALLGGVFFHLLPETIEQIGFGLPVAATLLGGFLAAFILEKYIHWHHCHGAHCDHHTPDHHHIKPFAYVNLLGDGVHNFMDGILIAAAYIVSIPTGIATTVAVLFHEIPQEIGDFAVLIHAGFSRMKALLVNFLSALTALLGAILLLLFKDALAPIIPYLLPFAAGTFLYLAGTDLIPELHKETRTARSVAQLLAMLTGVGLMILLLFL